jgi:hypothetical protein
MELSENMAYPEAIDHLRVTFPFHLYLPKRLHNPGSSTPFLTWCVLTGERNTEMSQFRGIDFIASHLIPVPIDDTTRDSMKFPVGTRVYYLEVDEHGRKPAHGWPSDADSRLREGQEGLYAKYPASKQTSIAGARPGRQHMRPIGDTVRGLRHRDTAEGQRRRIRIWHRSKASASRHCG